MAEQSISVRCGRSYFVCSKALFQNEIIVADITLATFVSRGNRSPFGTWMRLSFCILTAEMLRDTSLSLLHCVGCWPICFCLDLSLSSESLAKPRSSVSNRLIVRRVYSAKQYQ